MLVAGLAWCLGSAPMLFAVDTDPPPGEGTPPAEAGTPPEGDPAGASDDTPAPEPGGVDVGTDPEDEPPPVLQLGSTGVPLSAQVSELPRERASDGQPRWRTLDWAVRAFTDFVNSEWNYGTPADQDQKILDQFDEEIDAELTRLREEYKQKLIDEWRDRTDDTTRGPPDELIKRAEEATLLQIPGDIRTGDKFRDMLVTMYEDGGHKRVKHLVDRGAISPKAAQLFNRVRFEAYTAAMYDVAKEFSGGDVEAFWFSFPKLISSDIDHTVVGVRFPDGTVVPAKTVIDRFNARFAEHLVASDVADVMAHDAGNRPADVFSGLLHDGGTLEVRLRPRAEAAFYEDAGRATKNLQHTKDAYWLFAPFGTQVDRRSMTGIAQENYFRITAEDVGQPDSPKFAYREERLTAREVVYRNVPPLLSQKVGFDTMVGNWLIATDHAAGKDPTAMTNLKEQGKYLHRGVVEGMLSSAMEDGVAKYDPYEPPKWGEIPRAERRRMIDEIASSRFTDEASLEHFHALIDTADDLRHGSGSDASFKPLVEWYKQHGPEAIRTLPDDAAILAVVKQNFGEQARAALMNGALAVAEDRVQAIVSPEIPLSYQERILVLATEGEGEARAHANRIVEALGDDARSSIVVKRLRHVWGNQFHHALNALDDANFDQASRHFDEVINNLGSDHPQRALMKSIMRNLKTRRTRLTKIRADVETRLANLEDPPPRRIGQADDHADETIKYVEEQQAELQRIVDDFGFELPDARLRQRVQEALDAKPAYKPMSERVPTFAGRISKIFSPEGKFSRLGRGIDASSKLFGAATRYANSEVAKHFGFDVDETVAASYRKAGRDVSGLPKKFQFGKLWESHVNLGTIGSGLSVWEEYRKYRDIDPEAAAYRAAARAMLEYGYAIPVYGDVVQVIDHAMAGDWYSAGKAVGMFAVTRGSQPFTQWAMTNLGYAEAHAAETAAAVGKTVGSMAQGYAAYGLGRRIGETYVGPYVYKNSAEEFYEGVDPTKGPDSWCATLAGWAAQGLASAADGLTSLETIFFPKAAPELEKTMGRLLTGHPNKARYRLKQLDRIVNLDLKHQSDKPAAQAYMKVVQELIDTYRSRVAKALHEHNSSQRYSELTHDDPWVKLTQEQVDKVIAKFPTLPDLPMMLISGSIVGVEELDKKLWVAGVEPSSWDLYVRTLRPELLDIDRFPDDPPGGEDAPPLDRYRKELLEKATAAWKPFLEPEHYKNDETTSEYEAFMTGDLSVREYRLKELDRILRAKPGDVPALSAVMLNAARRARDTIAGQVERIREIDSRGFYGDDFRQSSRGMPKNALPIAHEVWRALSEDVRRGTMANRRILEELGINMFEYIFIAEWLRPEYAKFEELPDSPPPGTSMDAWRKKLIGDARAIWDKFIWSELDRRGMRPSIDPAHVKPVVVKEKISVLKWVPGKDAKEKRENVYATFFPMIKERWIQEVGWAKTLGVAGRRTHGALQRTGLTEFVVNSLGGPPPERKALPLELAVHHEVARDFFFHYVENFASGGYHDIYLNRDTPHPGRITFENLSKCPNPWMWDVETRMWFHQGGKHYWALMESRDAKAMLVSLLYNDYVTGMTKRMADVGGLQQQDLEDDAKIGHVCRQMFDEVLRSAVPSNDVTALSIVKQLYPDSRANPHPDPDDWIKYQAMPIPGEAVKIKGKPFLILPRLDQEVSLNLHAEVGVPRYAAVRPFEYEWAIQGANDASIGDREGVGLKLGDLSPGQKVNVSVRVYDASDDRMEIGSDELELTVVGGGALIDKVTVYHADEPDTALGEWEAETVATSIAAGHGYQLEMSGQAIDEYTGVGRIGVGLIPKQAVIDLLGETSCWQRHLVSSSTLMSEPTLSTDEPMLDDGTSTADTPTDSSTTDDDTSSEPNDEKLWRELANAAAWKTIESPDPPDPTQPVEEKIRYRVPSEIEEYVPFVVAVSKEEGIRYFEIARGTVTVVSAPTPSIRFATAVLHREINDRQSEEDLLDGTSLIRVTYTVQKGKLGKAVFTVLASTGGPKPKTLEVGYLKEEEDSQFFAKSFKAIPAEAKEVSADTGEYSCSGEWEATGAAVGTYLMYARIANPEPEADFFKPERLKDATSVWDLIEVEPAPDLDDEMSNLATQAAGGGGTSTQPSTGPASQPGGDDDGDDDDDDDDDDDTNPPIDPGLLDALAEQAEINAVEFKTSFMLQRLRRDGDVKMPETFFARAMAVKLLPVVRVDKLYPGMKVQIEIGYIENGKVRRLIKQTVPITGDEQQASSLDLDLSPRSELGPRWVGKQIFRGNHVAFLHVQVISRTGRYRTEVEKSEITFKVQEEGLGAASFKPMVFYDVRENNRWLRGTKFWDDANLRAKSPFQVSEVYGPEQITITHRFILTSPSGRAMRWRINERMTASGGGPHTASKALTLKPPIERGTWTVRHEVLDVKDKDGMDVLAPGSPAFLAESRFRIVQPKVSFRGQQDCYQIQHPPGNVKGAPVYEFLKDTDRPTARIAFHVQDVPIDCNMRGTLTWISPDTGRSGLRLPSTVNLKENHSKTYYGSYVFKKDDHDGLYTAEVTLEFYRAGRQPRAKLNLKPLRFRFKGRKRPGATLEDITVASRRVDYRIWDNGGLEDDKINVYIDGRKVTSSWLMPIAGKDFHLTIPSDRNEVIFTIESVSSERGPNTAAITFKGAIEVSRQTQSWWIEKPGQKASCVITYKPPAQDQPTPSPGGNPAP